MNYLTLREGTAQQVLHLRASDFVNRLEHQLSNCLVCRIDQPFNLTIYLAIPVVYCWQLRLPVNEIGSPLLTEGLQVRVTFEEPNFSSVSQRVNLHMARFQLSAGPYYNIFEVH
jgi:hypothetical protein